MRAIDNNGVNVHVGDSIAIQAQGITVKGKVASVDWFNTENGWYIEVTEANVPGGYCYWKQRDDGGKIVEVNGVAV